MEVESSDIQRKTKKGQNKREQTAPQQFPQKDEETSPFLENLPILSEEKEKEENMGDMEKNYVRLTHVDIPGKIEGLDVNVPRRWMGQWTNKENSV